MNGFPLPSTSLPVSAVFGLVAGSIYLVSCFRHRHGAFTILDAMLVVAIMAAVTAGSAPLLDAADETAKSAALKENLQVLSTQIELYKTEHDGTTPLLFKGGFPQLETTTNAEGVPGPRGGKFPFGPYLAGGVPLNPVTGSAVVEPTETYPPPSSIGTGGWLYHQATGRIVPQSLSADDKAAKE